MRIGKHRGSLTVGGLLMLSAVPLAAGAMRLLDLMGDAADTAESARFVAAPIPVVTRVVGSLLFCVLGALQFSSKLRQTHPSWHRAGGRIAAPAGFASALSGLWMTQYYPWVRYDGAVLYAIRLMVGTAMALSLSLSIAAIRKRDLTRHARWMIRAYALGLGAGTQVLTHIPWFMFPSIQGELARTVFMTVGWAINIGVAEWVIHKNTQYLISRS